MPNFLPPVIVGPLSTENRFVIVENHQSGTTLNLLVNGRDIIGTKTGAAGGRDIIEIDAAFLPLTAGVSLTATQEDSGGLPSSPSRRPVIVRAIPNPLGKGHFEGIIYHCVKFIRLSGLEPGSKFEIHQPTDSMISDASMIGSGETYNGVAKVSLTKTVDESADLVLRQKVGALISDYVYPKHHIVSVPLVPDRKLGQLTIMEANACGWHIDIEGTINGVETRITRKRDGVDKEFFGVGWDEQTRFWVPEPFRKDDTIIADQRMSDQCRIIPSDQGKYDVYERSISWPLIIPPVCRDADRINLMNIEPGADFTLYAVFKTNSGDKRQLVGGGQFPKEDPKPWIDINSIKSHPDQLPGTVPQLIINQRACGVTSAFSPPVAMEPLPMTMTPPKILQKPYACALYVQVANVHPGSWVSIHSERHGGKLSGSSRDMLGGEFNREYATTDEVNVQTPSGLLEGDTIWACVTGCSERPSHSSPAHVVAWTDILEPEIIEPVYPIDTAIDIRKLVTGARYFIRVIGRMHSGGKKVLTSYAWAPNIFAHVGTLYEDDEITVLESLCDTASSEYASKTVSVILGTMNVSASPNSAIIGYSNNYLITATDPQRMNRMVDGEVLFNGIKVGQTNKTFAWTAPKSGSPVTAQVNAPGYKPWSGSLPLIAPPVTPVIPGGERWRGPGGGSPGKSSSPTSAARYSYTCESITGGIKFSVKGEGFPTKPETTVTVEPRIAGIFTAFGVAHYCQEDYTASSMPKTFGPYMVNAEGKVEFSVNMVFSGSACLPTCSVTLLMFCNNLSHTHITGPDTICKCT